MWNIPTLERLNRIPKLYATENIPLEEKDIHLHFFLGGCDWYIAEYDGKDLFWGFAILNNDLEMAEWGYISFGELVKLKAGGWLEVDCELEEHFPVTKAKFIEKIRIAQGWPEPGAGQQQKKEKEPLSFPYTEEELNEILREASVDSVIDLKCPECGCALRCEPDAEDAFCHSCNKVVNTNNPVALGLTGRMTRRQRS